MTYRHTPWSCSSQGKDRETRGDSVDDGMLGVVTARKTIGGAANTRSSVSPAGESGRSSLASIIALRSTELGGKVTDAAMVAVLACCDRVTLHEHVC